MLLINELTRVVYSVGVSYQVSLADVTVAGTARSSHSGEVTKDSLLDRTVGVIERSVAVT